MGAVPWKQLLAIAPPAMSGPVRPAEVRMRRAVRASRRTPLAPPLRCSYQSEFSRHCLIPALRRDGFAEPTAVPGIRCHGGTSLPIPTRLLELVTLIQGQCRLGWIAGINVV